MSLFENFVYKNGEIVDNSWVKWFHFSVPDEEGKKREVARNRLSMMGHCKSCSVLSGCFFVKSRLPTKQGGPKGLLHNNCDCELLKISKPTYNVKAVCNITKFSGYVFSEKYATNGKKELFESLGFSIEDSQNLKDEYEYQAKRKYLNGDYIIRGLNSEYGQDINIIVELISPTGKNVNFVSGWKVHPLGLITCNTPLADD